MTNEEARQWFLKVYSEIKGKGYADENEEAYELAIKALEQESKTGHWKWLTEDKYRCSNCNHETRVDECMNKPMYDFCPFCNARMVEPQESEVNNG